MRRIHFGWLVLAVTACGSPGTSGSSGGFSLPPSTEGSGGGEAVGPGFTFNDPVVTADRPPPPVSGGTLLVLRDGHTAIVSDPDRDQIIVVDTTTLKASTPIALTQGDEPGRLVEDGQGRVHVALRGGGAIVSIDPATATLLSRRNVCDYPRGIAYDAKGDALHVACAGGELVTLPAAGGVATRTIKLQRDLRDVVVEGDSIWVSRFRAAEILRLDATGKVAERMVSPSIIVPTPPSGSQNSGDPAVDVKIPVNGFTPDVAWRMIAASAGGVLVSHQAAQTTEVQIQPGGYGGGICGGSIVHTGVTLFQSGQKPKTTGMPIAAPLPVDIAETPDGATVALVAAGSIQTGTSQQFGAATPVAELALPGMLTEEPQPQGPEGCGGFTSGSTVMTTPPGQPVAVAYMGTTLLVQTREPSMLVIGDHAVALPGDSRADTGHTLFHMAMGAGIACASCHPEGREDGRVWNFAKIGPRRTQSISGGLLGTEPFHWDGDMKDFTMLAHEVMGSRMMGPTLVDNQVSALSHWVDKLPTLKAPAPADPAAVERGHALYNDGAVGCGACHTGTKLTSNVSVDVGTGAAFQVPSLVGIGWRAPFLHDGCAPTLADRFGSCSGPKHGNTASLDSAQIADLVSFLETL
jgi:mono/diheme cytochrome c family protein